LETPHWRAIIRCDHHHCDLISRFECLPGYPSVDEVRGRTPLDNPINYIALLILYIYLQEGMGIEPSPLGHGSLQSELLRMTVRRVSVMREQRNGNRQQEETQP